MLIVRNAETSDAVRHAGEILGRGPRVGYDLDGTILYSRSSSLKTRPLEAHFAIVTGRHASRCAETLRQLDAAGVRPMVLVFTGKQDSDGAYVMDGRHECKAAAVNALGLDSYSDDEELALGAVRRVNPHIRTRLVAKTPADYDAPKIERAT